MTGATPTTLAELPELSPDLALRYWTEDVVGAVDALAASGATGLHRLAPDMVLAFRNDDVWRLSSQAAVGNTTAEGLARLLAAVGYDDPDGGFIPLYAHQVFAFHAPRHRPARRVLTRQLTPSSLGRTDALAARLVATVLADLAGRPTFDLATDLSYRVSAAFFGALCGLDDDEVVAAQHHVEDIARVFLNLPTPEDVRAVSVAVEAYLALVTHAVDRTLAGGPADPLAVEVLGALRDDLAGLGDPDVGLFAAANLFDGFHTTGAGIATALAVLLARPDDAARVRADPTRAAAAYDEATRLAPPLVLTHHLAVEDVEHDGVAIPEGTTVVLHWAGANRDPLAFADPGRFDLDRPPGPLLTFGRGPHACPGRSVSRRLAERVIGAVLAGGEDLVVDPTEGEWLSAASAAGLVRQPVRRHPPDR